MTSAGTTLGRYQLLSQIGAGGMGEVWRAHEAILRCQEAADRPQNRPDAIVIREMLRADRERGHP